MGKEKKEGKTPSRHTKGIKSQGCPDRAGSKAESFALKALRSRDISIDSVRRALALAQVPLNANRKGVMPKRKQAVRGAVCGLYVFADRTGLSLFSRRFPWLTRLLTAFCRAKHPDFPFTSVQVNVNYASRPHVDRNNLGASMIIGLGNYSGGDLWVHDDNGDHKHTLCEDIHQELMYRKGAAVRGRAVSVRNQWFRFDGNRLHFTEPFRGTRYSLVYYVCDRYADVPENVRIEVKKAGFPFQWGSEKLQKMLVIKKDSRQKLRRKLTKERHSYHKGIVPFLAGGDRVKYIQENPKVPGCTAYALYESYKRARTVEEAQRLGARRIDLAYDYDFDFMRLTALDLYSVGNIVEVLDATSNPCASTSKVASGSTRTLKVRIKDMSPLHTGLDIPRATLVQLAGRVGCLSEVSEDQWMASNGPLTCLSLPVLRTVLHWALTNRLRFPPSRRQDVVEVFRRWGKKYVASLVSSSR